MKKRSKTKSPTTTVAHVMGLHFKKPLHELMTTGRKFPVTARLDLEAALRDLIPKRLAAVKQLGYHCEYNFGSVSISMLVAGRHSPAVVAPLEYEEVDAGETFPARCLKSCLWFGEADGMRICILFAAAVARGEPSGWQVDLAHLRGDKKAEEFSRKFLADVEHVVSQGASYRGKVISLEQRDDYSGRAGSVRVHKLKSVSRDEVILPEKTLRLLERNVMDFIQLRPKLRGLSLSVKKGLLFYGPPGTGKTHTIHYLASQLPNHTTLLITAGQVGLLDEYVQLARFLQPAVLVLEDVDLIARSRTSMRNSCEESLLNKLLNEMDGLREDAELLFILTTNRPQDLEEALSARPGRVDQAIEFPLPDEDGRRKLVQLYAGNLKLSDVLAMHLVKKTKNSSGAFIKELMRRAAQFLVRSGGDGKLEAVHVEEALDEMLFAGGSLNVKMLGGAAEG
jgi:AAA+ superfamily predicted ATPase